MGPFNRGKMRKIIKFSTLYLVREVAQPSQIELSCVMRLNSCFIV